MTVSSALDGDLRAPATLLALAARVEGDGRYDVAKLLRAVATARVQRGAWTARPDPATWSPHEVIAHLRDAQTLLAQRGERILTEDTPDLEAQQVWAWNAAPPRGDHRGGARGVRGLATRGPRAPAGA